MAGASDKSFTSLNILNRSDTIPLNKSDDARNDASRNVINMDWNHTFGRNNGLNFQTTQKDEAKNGQYG